MATESQKKSGPPKIVALNKALKLAAKFVSEMSGSAEDEAVEVEAEGRPERLGLGAKVPRQVKVGPSNDPVERKLYAKLDAGKRKASKNKDSTPPSVRDRVDEDDDEEDLESRSNAFPRKRPIPLTLQLQDKKKQK